MHGHGVDIPSGQSSPGSLQSGQHPSKGRRHIPHSLSLVSHFHTATADQLLILTFIPALKGR
ncbi:MAG: hypothetical protein MJE68_15520 [Proteobacteria bacterium]|nr:hypothetical protein [Pseudomonadota bacterium]